MTSSRNQPTGARSKDFQGPRRSAQVDVSIRQNARQHLLSLDQYGAVPKGHQGFWSSPGRGVSGESSN